MNPVGGDAVGDGPERPRGVADARSSDSCDNEPAETSSDDPGAGSARADGLGQDFEGDVEDDLARIIAEYGHLRADQLREHLQSDASRSSGSQAREDLLECVSALDFLDSVVGESTGALPEKLGDYRILGVLGRGGMGTVFEAFQESLERTVALKVLSPQLTNDPRMRRRFRTEARANATLHHQHIVPVFGFGEAQGYLYFAMERVDGISLDKHISARKHRRQPVYEPRDAARRFAGVADALHHAHRRGVLHRDVKPGNVLVHPDGSLALADFGLSKIVGEHSQSVSRSGGFLGTLQYAAPEQALGREQNEQSDLYSLGVTIYECLTGSRPIEAESTEAVLHALTREECPPLRRQLPRAPKDLEAVLARLLARDPRDRYRDGEALARDLQRVADDEPVQVRRQSLAVKLWRRIKRAPGLSTAIAIALVLLVLSLDLLLQVRTETDEQRYQAELSGIAAELASGPGESDGPSGLCGLLTGEFGTRDRSDGPTRELLDRLQAVNDERRDDPRPAQWWSVLWQEVHEPTWLSELEQRGELAALESIDRMIDERQPRLAQLEQSTAFELYQLYFGRAVLRLTESIGDTQAAEKDLLRAEFLRPGAIAPQLLQALVEWNRTDAKTLTDEFERIVARAGAVSGQVAGRLLATLTGADRLESAMLMDFELRPSVADELSSRLDRFGILAASTGGEIEGPLWRELESRARSLLQSASSDTSVRAQRRDEGLRLLRTRVGERSLLRAFELVFAWLGAADLGTADLGPGQDGPLVEGLSPRQELRGFELIEELLRGRSRELESLGRFIDEQWVVRVGEIEPIRLARLRARIRSEAVLASEAASRFIYSNRRQQAEQALAAWRNVDPDNPEIALLETLLTLRTAGREGSVEQLKTAAVSAFIALDSARDRSAVKRRILTAMEWAENEAGGLRRERERFLLRSREIRGFIENY